jgi:hypothetical protein
MTIPSFRRITTASITGLIVAAVFITTITLIGDLYVVDGKMVIKDWLKAAYGHHWVGKGIWALIFFAVTTVITYSIVKQKNLTLTPFTLRLATNAMIAGSLIMLVFFCYVYFKH